MPLLDRMAFQAARSSAWAPRKAPGAEIVAKHPFPRVELEYELHLSIVEIDKAAAVRSPTDVLDIDHCSCKARLACGVFHIGKRAKILGLFGRAGKMQMAATTELLPRLDQPFMDRIWSAVFAIMRRSIACSSQVH
jgi:hypothetical protein